MRVGLLKGIFGGREPRRLWRYERRLRAVERLGAPLRGASDEAITAQARDLRRRVSEGLSLDAAQGEAFALAREASHRVLAMRPFDVQLIGAMALHDGLVAEMKTGEGKTLVATLPAFLNALGGSPVHVVTVNDYLAERDAEWMGPLYRMLGLQVGVILERMGEDPAAETAARQAAYAADVTYGTNHEIAFDYLRDNLAGDLDEVVHRGFAYAIIDEVDFLLIDEARTPLIISAPSRDDPELFAKVDKVVRRLEGGVHWLAEAKTRRAALTDRGLTAVERAFEAGPLTLAENLPLFHAVTQAVQAHALYKLDVDYIVEDRRVYIVDEFTGRVSEDKRYADGLHQALEAKEGVEVRAEDRTVAKVTYQTFFGRYQKLSGMTGTAWSEREELRQTYGLDVVRVPTNQPLVRQDYEGLVYETLADKLDAAAEEIAELREAGRPVLVGTTSVRESEQLAARLKAAGVPHEVLNAKNHRAEAAVIAQAGRRGAVTISTNMAGRGTDIVLGGKPEGGGGPRVAPDEQVQVVAAGGLHVIGTAHHEAVRIDDQLRGRAGRQGDPGSSQFIVALDDEVYLKFGEAELAELRRELRRSGHDHAEPVPRRLWAGLLGELQRKVDEENRGMRREVLRYDMVLHQQREALYAWRRSLLEAEEVDAEQLVEELVAELAEAFDEDADGLRGTLAGCFGAPFEPPEGIHPEAEEEAAADRALELLSELEAAGADRALLRAILLDSVDELWTDHLGALERLEEAIGLRGYAQLDPLVEWRREAAMAYRELMAEIRARALALWFAVSRERGDDGDEALCIDDGPDTRPAKDFVARKR